jgi:hypothetical protein
VPNPFIADRKTDASSMALKPEKGKTVGSGLKIIRENINDIIG